MLEDENDTESDGLIEKTPTRIRRNSDEIVHGKLYVSPK